MKQPLDDRDLQPRQADQTSLADLIEQSGVDLPPGGAVAPSQFPGGAGTADDADGPWTKYGDDEQTSATTPPPAGASPGSGGEAPSVFSEVWFLPQPRPA